MVLLLELIGTVAFAFSGCMVANTNKMDIFGVWILGTTTAVGGGAIRDIFLGIIPPNMFQHGIYVATATVTVAVWILVAARGGNISEKVFVALVKIMEICDSIGLGVFAVVGSQTAIRQGFGDNRFLVIFVGVLTGVGGGFLRDIMADTTPVIFRERIYALAAMAGSMVYVFLLLLAPEGIAMLAGIVTVFVIRTLANKKGWNLPVFVLKRDNEEK